MTRKRERDDFTHDGYRKMMNISFVPDEYHVLTTGILSILEKQ
jgi:hypothetical protein